MIIPKTCLGIKKCKSLRQWNFLGALFSIEGRRHDVLLKRYKRGILMSHLLSSLFRIGTHFCKKLFPVSTKTWKMEDIFPHHCIRKIFFLEKNPIWLSWWGIESIWETSTATIEIEIRFIDFLLPNCFDFCWLKFHSWNVFLSKYKQ